MRDQLVWPQPGYQAPPFTGPGFVIRTQSFNDFAEAVRGKIGQIVGSQHCTINPPTATNPLRTRHDFVVSVENPDSSPAAGVTVHIEVVAGPHLGATGSGTDQNGDGAVGFFYTGTNAETDTIQASGSVDGQPFSCSATKTWIAAQVTCDTDPNPAVTPVGTEHTVSATFTRSDGSLAAGETVAISILSGPNAGRRPEAQVTNAGGRVEFSYTGGSTPGTDVIEFDGFD